MASQTSSKDEKKKTTVRQIFWIKKKTKYLTDPERAVWKLMRKISSETLGTKGFNPNRDADMSMKIIPLKWRSL